VTGREALAAATARLRAAGIEHAAGDARRLLAAALDLPAERLSLVLPDPLTDPSRFETLVARRLAREPVSRIVGGRWFHGHWFAVTPDTLDPRPETELVVDLGLSAPFGTVLDLGTGTGCILLSLLAARPEAIGVGTDLSAAALAVAERNAAVLGLSGRAHFRPADWFDGVDGRFDLIVANPPYIAASEMPKLDPEVRLHDPALALTDGADGLAAYREILARAVGHLAPGGRILLEIGHAQGEAVSALARAAGFVAVAVHPDLNGHDRVISGRNRAESADQA
jgi:release factor glutamine methyltransferase